MISPSIPLEVHKTTKVAGGYIRRDTTKVSTTKHTQQHQQSDK